jgi:predicted lipoprotein with Yx(FWY)xxD motif
MNRCTDGMKRKAIVTGAALSAVWALGCGSGGDEPQPAQASDEAAVVDAVATVDRAAPAARPRGPKVKLRRSPYGTILFSGGDRAVYIFTHDGMDKTRCYGACAKAWPPFFAKGKPRAGKGVDRSLLGTIRRRDGRRQVTYRGQPLYFYVGDPPREVRCQNVVEFGGTWLVVDAAGQPLR